MKRSHSTLDIAVAVVMIMSLVFAIGIVTYPWIAADGGEALRATLHSQSTSLSGIALASCLLLVLWVLFASGLESRLWDWCPPFWFFRKQNRLVRGFLVFALIAGTIAGSLAT